MPSPTSTPWKSRVDVREAAFIRTPHLLVVIRNREYLAEPLVSSNGALVRGKRIGSRRHARLALIEHDPHGLGRDNDILGDIRDLLIRQLVPALARSLVVEIEFRIGQTERLGDLGHGHGDDLQRVEHAHRVPPREAQIDAVVLTLIRDKRRERTRSAHVDGVDPCPTVIEQVVVNELTVELQVVEPHLRVIEHFQIVEERFDGVAETQDLAPIDLIDIAGGPRPYSAIIRIHRGLEVCCDPTHGSPPTRRAPQPNLGGYIQHENPAAESRRRRSR